MLCVGGARVHPMSIFVKRKQKLNREFLKITMCLQNDQFQHAYDTNFIVSEFVSWKLWYNSFSTSCDYSW
jgi:hypothetical protein